MHICGQCQIQFDTEAEYLNHRCSETGVEPTDPRSMGADYEAIQQSALERGKKQQPFSE